MWEVFNFTNPAHRFGQNKTISPGHSNNQQNLSAVFRSIALIIICSGHRTSETLPLKKFSIPHLRVSWCSFLSTSLKFINWFLPPGRRQNQKWKRREIGARAAVLCSRNINEWHRAAANASAPTPSALHSRQVGHTKDRPKNSLKK